MKRELDAMIEQLRSSVEIGYNIAMDLFKKESKKKCLGFQILNIPITSPYSLTQTQNEDRDQGKFFEENGDGPKEENEPQQTRDA